MNNNEITLKNEKYVAINNAVRENTIVNEIQMIKMQTAQTLLMASIEIGRRLTEAKALVKHGEWESWLSERVQFSQRTANNHMKIYREYGQNELALNSQSIANLNYTQALTLLSVPEENREKFIEENNVKDMTIAELKATVETLTAETVRLKKDKDDIVRQYEAKEKETAMNLEKIKQLKENISQLERQSEEAKKNQEKEVQQRIEKAIVDEKRQLAECEKNNEKLSSEIQKLKSAQAEAIEKAKLETKARAEKEFAKREKELKKIATSLEGQLEKAAKETAKAYQKADEAVEKNKKLEDITKCNLLIEDILKKYNQVLVIIRKYGELNPKNADEILNSLKNSIALIEGKAKLSLIA